MISSVLAALVALVLPQDAATERLPRPTDDALLAALQAKAPGARIVSSEFHDTPRGGARAGCGLIEIGGEIEPFHILTSWKEALPERAPVVVMITQGEDGVERRHPDGPLPAEPAHWRTWINAPVLEDLDGDGVDRRDRNRAISERRMALLMCKTLTRPGGEAWVTEFEPDPDPARQRRNEERAKALTDMLFGARATQ
jgi:hypothetical protein